MAKRPFFFHHTLGFRRNPFGALEADEWIAVAILPDTISKLFSTHFTHLQLLGSMGAGKTTSLRKLADQFANAGGPANQRVAYEYLAQGERVMKTDTAVLDILLLDEAQRLNRRSRRRLLASAAQFNGGGLRLILSSHKDLTPYFVRRGLPLVTIDLDETLTLAHYERLLARRLAYFALPGAAHTTLSPDAISWLYETFYPNMRDAEYFLYEVWQRETAVREVTAVHLQELFTENR